MGSTADNKFNAAVRDNQVALMTYARSVTRNSWMADEAVQETLIRAWRYWPTFRNESHVLTWLITICRRVVIDIASRNVDHEQINEDVLQIPSVSEDIGVHDFISELPLAQREVVVLCSVIGCDYETASHILEVPIGTVRSRLSRARQTLSEKIYGEHRNVG